MARNKKNSSSNTSHASGGGSGGNARRNNNNRPRRRSSKVPGRKFWGDATSPRIEHVAVTMSDEPAAVVLSLGEPPFASRSGEPIGSFEMVYMRAAAMASALAAAGGLDKDVPSETPAPPAE